MIGAHTCLKDDFTHVLYVPKSHEPAQMVSWYLIVTVPDLCLLLFFQKRTIPARAQSNLYFYTSLLRPRVMKRRSLPARSARSARLEATQYIYAQATRPTSQLY